MDFANFMGKMLKIVQNRWRLVCMSSELGLQYDESLKDLVLTRAQESENTRLAITLRNDHNRQKKSG